MSKALTDKEMAEIIVTTIAVPDVIPSNDEYHKFLIKLADLIAMTFGGEVESISFPPNNIRPGFTDPERWMAYFKWSERVPEGGGVFAKYDNDTTIEEWKEECS